MAEQEYLAPSQDSHILYCHHCWNLLSRENETLNKCIDLATSQSKKNATKTISKIGSKIEEIQEVLGEYYDRDDDEDDE
jgi:hypothetical protein